MEKEGILLFDKPLLWTSFDVVNKIKVLFKKRLHFPKIKIGHAGTLDPMATGLLIVCYGAYTKRIDEFQAQSKEYSGTIMLGATRPSFDIETDIDKIFPFSHITPEAIEAARLRFLGKIEQFPPVFSAVKVDGKRLYEHARRGIDVELKARSVEIHEFEITRIALPEIDFRIVCSKGTYIRALANDFGKALESGSYLAALRRTKIGNFSIENAWKVDDFIANTLQMEEKNTLSEATM